MTQNLDVHLKYERKNFWKFFRDYRSKKFDEHCLKSQTTFSGQGSESRAGKPLQSLSPLFHSPPLFFWSHQLWLGAPWASPGQTVVCCAQLLSRVPLCAAPWTAACQAPLSMGFSRLEYCSGLSCPPLSRDRLNPGIKPVSLMSPELAGGFFTASGPGLSPQAIILPVTRNFYYV